MSDIIEYLLSVAVLGGITFVVMSVCLIAVHSYRYGSFKAYWAARKAFREREKAK
jgi:hypothetical protein